MTFESMVGGAEFVCECADIECIERIELSLQQYEAVRDEPTHFFVKPGHELADQERVVESHPEFLIVQKIGHAGERATELDPRAED